MKRFVKRFKDFFAINPREAFAIITLIIIIIIVLLLPRYYISLGKGNKADFNDFESRIKLFENMAKLHKAAEAVKALPDKSIMNQDTGKKKQGFIYKEDDFAVELNSADSLQLMRLRGIGPSFAKRIISYRKLLGGYCNKEQLMEVWGMDRQRYDGIKEHIAVNADSIHKININTIAFKKLMKHPYIKYDAAYAIINYKKLHGDIKDMNELKACCGIPDSIFRRLMPYVKLR